MSTLRELKGRIGSVASTGKITSAMKMISSAKMHKAEQGLKKLLPYRKLVQSVISHLLATDGEFTSPLIEERDVRRVGVVVLGSDDGLCGAYNINIFKHLLGIIARYKQQYGENVDIEIYPVGKKLARASQKIAGGRVSVKVVEGINTRSTTEQISLFTEALKQGFEGGSLDKVDLVYMHFKSMSKQILTCDQLLPVSYTALVAGADAKADNSACLFEPSPNAIFNSVLPLHIKSTMQEVFVENVASENAARVMAMQSASDNANKLLESLRLEYNKLRQQGITTELLDILGGQVEK
ncbi:MAG: ATP synthase F1 subunit gamma [Muribaculaceae bacterium]